MDHLLKKAACQFLVKAFWLLFSMTPLFSDTIEDISVYGNRRTKNHVILRELSFLSGDTVSDNSLMKDRKWLMRLDFLKKIEFLRKSGYNSDTKHLLIVVQEKPILGFSPILGSDDRYGLSGGLGIALENIWGHRERFSVNASIGKIKRLESEYSNPWIWNSLHFSSRLFAWYQDWPYLYPDYPQHFDLKQSGGRIELAKCIGRRIQTGLSAGFERTVSNLKDIIISEDNTDELIEFGYFLHYDSRDWPVYPKSGYFIDLFMRHHWEVENLNYTHILLEIHRFQPVFKENILAMQCHIELAEGTIPVYKRIHLGGSDSIRGYANGCFWGDNAVYTSVEYRFPMIYVRHSDMGIHAGYAGVLFIDAGTSWKKGEGIQNMNLYRSLGFGIHGILSPYVIRLEYATHFKGWGYISAGFNVKF